MKFYSILKLIRFEHGLMLSLAVLTSVFFTVSNVRLDINLIGLMAIPFLIEAGAFALNDYFDIETDRLNKKDRPLVTGEISKETALTITIASLFTAIIISIFYNIWIVNITGFFILFSVLYDWKLKDLPLIGNSFIGFSMAIPFIFGNLAYSDTLIPENIILFCMAFTIGLAREIIKTDGDVKMRKAKTLPFYIGKGNSLYIAVIIILLFLVIGFYSYTLISFEYISGILWLLSISYYAYLSIKIILYNLNAKVIHRNKFFSVTRRDTLITLVVGLIALLLTKFGV